MSDNDDIPMVRAELRADGCGLKVLCPFCGDTHIHGWSLGGRAAHCRGGPPSSRQYVLVAASDTVAAANTEAMSRIEGSGLWMSALVDLLARVLEVPVDKLDPKDVMRFHRPSYDALSGRYPPWADW